MALPDKETYRISEIAYYFDVSDNSVRTWIEHGKLEVIYTPGGQMRITRESIEKSQILQDREKKRAKFSQVFTSSAY